ncbi:MAG: ABC transporter permease, partial [Clostridiales bacterium]
LDSAEKNNEFVAIESRTFGQEVWRKFKKNKLALAGSIFLLVLTLFSILYPMISSYTYDGIDLSAKNLSPSVAHWFGTDSLGRDLFIRILYGGRISLTVGLVSAVINLLIGTLYGGISGFCGGRIDQIMMRVVDIIYSIPTLLYVLLITMVLGNNLYTVIIAIAISSWAGMARIVRAQILSLKEQEFALAAISLGASKRRILIRHLLLNSIGPIIVTTTLNIPTAIFTEAFLSFIGCGIAIPQASWGTLSSEALQVSLVYPLQLFFPAAAICFTMFSLNFLGDGLNDAFDPHGNR